jgi:hypothetical protein
VNAAFSSSLVSGRITPLDAVLEQQGATRGNGGSVGVRVGYALTPRFTAEFTLDAPLAQLRATDALLAGVEASRASFITAWNDQTGFVRSGGGVVFTNPVVTSVAAIDDRRGRQIFTTGALNINFPLSSRIVPYATVGAGVVSNTGGAPSVTLMGDLPIHGLELRSTNHNCRWCDLDTDIPRERNRQRLDSPRSV